MRVSEHERVWHGTRGEGRCHGGKHGWLLLGNILGVYLGLELQLGLQRGFVLLGLLILG